MPDSLSTMTTVKLSKIPEKILIIKPSSLGDIVHSLPFLNSIRESFPKAEIHWIVAKGLEGLLERHPMINKLWIINKEDWKKFKKIKGTLKEFRELFALLKRERFDLVIDLQGLLRSGILTAATGAPVRIGFKEAREGSGMFYTHKIEGGSDIHAVDRYLRVAKSLGCDVSEVCFPLPLFFENSEKVRNLLPSGKYAVIVPGARWLTKRWHSENFGELASRLPLKSVVVGGKADTEISDEVVKSSKGNAISMTGKTSIGELIEIMKGAKFVISNDSGPMHIAAAVGVPVFAIFGPTNPVRTGPYGEKHIIIKKEMECAPCYKKTCKSVRCLEMISVKDVSDIVIKKLMEMDA